MTSVARVMLEVNAAKTLTAKMIDVLVGSAQTAKRSLLVRKVQTAMEACAVPAPFCLKKVPARNAQIAVPTVR